MIALLVLLMVGQVWDAGGENLWESEPAFQESLLHISQHKLCKSPYLEFKDDSNVQLFSIHPAKALSNNTSFWKRELLVDGASARKSFSHNGGLYPIEKLLQKLLKGRAVTIVALGGSVTRGHGVQDPLNGWIAQLFAWISSTFPNAKHRLLNRAIPAVTSGYVSACIPELVLPGTDLVIVEFTYNDNVFGGADHNANNNPARRGLERLLRRLIGLDDSPGILYFHYWAPAKSHPGFLNDEDTINALLKYYSIPTISMRDALNTDLEQNPELLDKYWQPSPDPKIHPNCLGSRYMADLVIGTLRNVYLETGVWGTGKKINRLQRPFLLEGNWQHSDTACVLEQNIRSFVRANKGWDWIDEGRTKRQHKKGFISTNPGDYIDLEVPLYYVPKLSSKYLVAIGGLISYQHMGTMELKCIGGCSCPLIRFNMFHAQEFSMTGWRYLNVTRTSDQSCIIRALNTDETSTSEHKLKISSMMLSARS